MAKKKILNLRNKNLGIALFAALIIQYIAPVIKLGSLSWIATLIYLLVALYLVFF